MPPTSSAPVVSTVLSRAQWDAVAFLRRADKPVNAAILRATVDGSFDDLAELADRDLTVALLDGQPVELADHPFLPSVDITLTTAGREVGAWAVQIAGALYWLAGRRAQTTTLLRLVDAARLSDNDIAELDRRRWIQLDVNIGGEPTPIGFGDLGARRDGVTVRITRLGKRYTTQHS